MLSLFMVVTCLLSVTPLVMSDYLGQLDCQVARELHHKLYSDFFLFSINLQSAQNYFNKGLGCSAADSE